MKRFMIIFAAAILFMLTCAYASASSVDMAYDAAESESFCAARGDTDEDGSVTPADARYVLRVAVGLEEPDARRLLLADMNSDNSVNASDARTVLRISVGLSDAPEHGETGKVTVTEANCTTDGTTASLCMYCGKLYNYGRIKTPGHIPSVWKTVKEPTCSTLTGKGLAQQTCIYCGTIINTKVLDNLPHRFGPKQYETAPSCFNYVNTIRVCSVCGYEERAAEKPSGAHTWTWETANEVSCTEDGLKKEVCRHCGAESGNTQVIKCVGSHELPIDWQTVTNPTCTEDGLRVKICRVCRKIVEEEPIPAGHRELDYSRVTAKKPTCTEEGISQYYCFVCKQTITEAIPAKGHTQGAALKETAPTCTEDGCLVYTCADCGETLTEAIPAKGHTPGNREYYFDEDRSLWGVVKCSVCGEELQREKKFQ